MKKDCDAYIVVAPTGKSKIYSVAARRVGSRDRYTVIATCTHETNADSIVDGLKLLQSEVVKIETGVQLSFNAMRDQYNKERQLHTETRAKLNDAHHQKRMADDQVRTIEQQLYATKQELSRVVMERDAAQKKAKEQA